MPNDASGPFDEREILRVLTAARDGDFSARMPIDDVGLAGKVADTLNQVLSLNGLLLGELRRMRHEVGREGRTQQRASMDGAVGDWRACTDAVNDLVTDVV